MRWAVHIETAGGGTVFQQTVVVPLDIASVGVPGAQLYAWWPDDAGASILTTVCGSELPGAVLAQQLPADGTQAHLENITGTWPDSGEAYIGPAKGPWERVAFAGIDNAVMDITARGVYGGQTPHARGEIVRLAPPTIGAEQGIMTTDARPSDYTDSGIWLTFDWLSPVYRLHLADGATFHIDFHNVGLYALRTSLAAIQTQVCRGTRRPWLYIPEHGMWLTAKNTDGGVEVVGACSAEALDLQTENSRFARIQGGRLIQGWLDTDLENCLLMRSRPGSLRLYLLGEASGAIWLSENDVEGDLRRWADPVEIVKDATLLGAAVSDDGGTLFVLVQDGGGQVRLEICGLEWDETAGRALVKNRMTITPLVRRRNSDGSVEFVPFSGLSSQLHELRWQEGKLYLIADVGGEQHLYVSTDGGATWEE